MKKTMIKQEGMTYIGVFFVICIIIFAVLFTLRLIPLYTEKMQVISVMNTIVKRPDAKTLTAADARKYFLSNLYATSNINRFDDNNVKDIVKVIMPEKGGQHKILHVQYQATSNLFDDLNLLILFDKKMELRGPY